MSEPEIRELTLSDIGLLGSGVARPTTVKTIRDSHHSVARLLAEGLRLEEVSGITGYTTARIRQLKADPAFQELLEFYRQNINAAAAQFSERLVAMSFDAQQELQRRLDEEPESFTIRELKDIVMVGADRTGHGPKTTNVNINVDLAQRVEAARRRVTSNGPAS